MVNTRKLAKAVSPIAPMTGKNKLKSVKKLQAQHMEAKMLDEMEKKISSTEGDEEVTSELRSENTKNKGASNTKQPPTQDVANDNTNNNIKVTSLDTNIVCENDDVLALEKVGGGSVLQNEIGILAVGNIKEVPHQSINEEIVQNEGCLAEIVKTTNASVEAVLEAVLEGGFDDQPLGVVSPINVVTPTPINETTPSDLEQDRAIEKEKNVEVEKEPCEDDVYLKAINRTKKLSTNGDASTSQGTKQTVQAAPKPWSSLFTNNREPSQGMKLTYIPPTGDMVDLSNYTLHSMVELWGYCLVDYFVGVFPGPRAVNAMIQKWGVPCKARPHRKGWIIFKFQREADRDQVLLDGPHSIYGKMCYLKVLDDNFSTHSDEFLKVPIWVKFHGLPMRAWREDILSAVASRVGKPLATDRVTQEKARSSYARVLIEVDAAKPPPLQFDVKLPSGEIYSQGVVYETFPNYCYHCKMFGHHPFTCKTLHDLERKERGEEVPPQEPRKNTTFQIEEQRRQIYTIKAKNRCYHEEHPKAETTKSSHDQPVAESLEREEGEIIEEEATILEENPLALILATPNIETEEQKEEELVDELDKIMANKEEEQGTSKEEKEDVDLEVRIINDIRDSYHDDVVIQVDFIEGKPPNLHMAHMNELELTMKPGGKLVRLDNWLSITDDLDAPGITFTKACLEGLPGVIQIEDGYAFDAFFMRNIHHLFLGRYFSENGLQGNTWKKRPWQGRKKRIKDDGGTNSIV
ncbi:unnamed protein product [Cuscuta europaea]|uniref:DUF4283 domain-containing protein n=1 Tax=Cuscuta europaea TaxID=41803 RepID=A0A9P0Z794_CUSEU|nr:unnamed protein product [Cuscuta europaea]